MIRVAKAPSTEVLPAACSACPVRSSSLCSALSDEQLRALGAIAVNRRYAAGQTIVTEGEQDFFAHVVEGVVLEKKTLADGREQVVGLLLPADSVGRPFNRRAEATVEAVSDVALCTFDKARFERLLGTNLDLRQALLAQVLRELSDARAWMLMLGQKTATERVATFLARFAARAAPTSCHRSEQSTNARIEFELPIGRSQIAAFLGIALETVSRKLTALRKDGIIDIVDVKTVRILDLARLRIAAGDVTLPAAEKPNPRCRSFAWKVRQPSVRLGVRGPYTIRQTPP